MRSFLLRTGARLLLVAGWVSAHAAGISSVSPQGEVAQVQQVVVHFSEGVVPLGDLRQPEPVQLACQGASAVGSAHWNSDREWVFDFKEALPPGVRCTVSRRPNWKPLNGELTGQTEFRFSTGGPSVRRVHPWPGSIVEEDQLFVLELTGAVVEADLPRKAWCEMDGLAETLPVVVVGGADRAAILKARRLDQLPAERVLVLGCGRPFPSKGKVRLVWGKGIAARVNAQVVSTTAQTFGFKVRAAFSAEFSCERERANAPCMPIRPLVVRFSAPVTRALAEQARLKPAAGGAALAPFFDKDDRAGEVEQVVFKGPLAERAAFTVELPRELKDLAGRALANAGSFPLKVATGDAPPIAKFAAAPFGVVEWGEQPMLPVTLRHVQGDLRPQASGGQVRVKKLSTDAEVLGWYRKLERYHESSLTARQAGWPEKDWYEVQEYNGEDGRVTRRRIER